MQTIELYSLLAAGIVLFIAIYWIRFFTGKPRGSLGSAKPTSRDPRGGGFLAAAYGYEESYSPGASPGHPGPLPVRKKRQRETPTTYRKHDD